ncbi:IPT/TIG domain-containing protein [Patescibacteria group bacterium]|nr:IPT/TIG domain-containing protein [Patescibacteria group bacterium]
MNVLQRLTLLFSGLAIVFTLSVGILVPVQQVYAQSDTLEDVGAQSGLGDEDLRIVIARLIRTFLTVLGIIAVVIVLYGGFVWMTAGGDPDKVKKAKDILINGGIGLGIFLLSWAITSFVLSALLGATGTGDGTGTSSGGYSSTSGLGGGSASTFAVSTFSPEGEVSIRNIVPRITFSRQLDEASVVDNIIFTKTETGEVVDGTLVVSGNKASFTPSAFCPEPSSTRHCFDADTQYTVTVGTDIQSSAGVSLDCSIKSCSSSFTTGSLIDTEDPVASISYPDNGDSISVDSFTLVQVEATDDSEVSTADFYGNEAWFDSVGASGDDLSDVTIESIWYTDGLEEGTRYNIEVTVSDIAGNEDSDTVRIVSLPAHCFDDELSGDEEDVDCGGSCGACDGSTCTDASECSDAICESGICVSYPEIQGVSPASGAVGTFVTISGTGFSTSGTVYFSNGAGGFVSASQPSCASGWGSSEVIVEVPVGASDGPIKIDTRTGYSDQTDDDNGPLIDDFDVNDVEHPNLCSIYPRTAEVGDSVTVSGTNFGSTQGLSLVYFDTTQAGSYTSWSDTSSALTVPSLTAGDFVDVSISVGGVSSNTVSFGVDFSDQELPTIYSVSPASGGVGQYVTISGTHFGSRLGSVWFSNPVSGYTAQGSIAFPSECDNDIWNDNQITIIVPSAYTNEEAIDEIAHNLYITTQAGVDSEAITFTVTSADPTPGICAIDPAVGPVGTGITVYGDNFGTSVGSLEFYNGVLAIIESGDWSNGSIISSVPTEAQTGVVTVTSLSGVESNPFNFEVGAGSAVTATSLTGGYAWYFSTGTIPVVPELLIACSDTLVSAVPNSRFTREACTNSVLMGKFNTLIDESTLNSSNIRIYECDGTECEEDSSLQVPFGSIAISSSTTQTSFIWNADPTYNSGSWKTSMSYYVVVSDGIESTGGISLSRDVSWTFRTSSSSVDCDVEEVLVSPVTDTLEELGGTSEFNALPLTACQVLDPTDYAWDWDTDISSSISVGSCPELSSSYCAQTTALFEGTTILSAEELASGTDGSATVVVNFTDPYVSSYTPSCDSACVNGEISITFNTVMDDSIESPGYVMLYSCVNELCATLTQIDAVANCSDVEGCGEVELQITDPDYSGVLDSNSFYRVIVSGSATSASGVALTRTNYGSDFSWTFSTKDDDTLCSVDRITLSPEDVVLESIGDSQYYEVLAFGSPDSCSVSGQELSAYGYDWSWTDPIISDAGIAEWITIAGSLLDVGRSSIPEGCTASCLAQGSGSYYSVCGDWIRGTGEDCEDGNVIGGDGCSANCLNEGTSTCPLICSATSISCTQTSDCQDVCVITDTVLLTGTCSISSAVCSAEIACPYSTSTCGRTGVGCCGNGTTDLHEECDDGGIISGDGCSSMCLNEGSRMVGATCGNGDIAHEYGTGGEECDDGNTSSGDGCSSICLNEGSTSITQVSAECGDGIIYPPFETCDDGGVANGDGCSSSCLREGKNSTYSAFGSTGRCGDSAVDQNSLTGAGEDCDGGEGCSTSCLWAGSSLSYSEVSVCGDGIAGVGEYDACEDSTYGAGSDSKIDPVQMAQIIDEAGEHVDTDTQLATTTVAVSLDSLDASTSLSLSCVAEIDADCNTGYGPADNKCCMPRPQVDLFPNGSEACRNAELYGLFTTKMAVSSFTDNLYIELNLGTGEDCPSGHTVLSTVSAGATLWQRVMHFFTAFVGLDATAQSMGDCIVPITSVTQAQTSDGLYKVTFHYNTLLEADASYTIHVIGDTLGDTDRDGALSYYGVAMNGGEDQSFTTQDGICGLDAVLIDDADQTSPNTFTMTGEQHTFTATAYSYDTGTAQSIEPIAGVYDWGWTTWALDNADILDWVSEQSGDVEQASVVYEASGISGEANIVTSAIITSDITGESFTCSDSPSILCSSDDSCPDDETCEADSVSGLAELTAFVCENPWPSIEYFPFEDNADGYYPGVGSSATLGSGWMNFSMYYCRDAGDEDSTSDDYPELQVLSASQSGTDEILKEYFLNVYSDDGLTGDVIGVRVISNASYLSPLAWYYASGFAGSPSETTVDGFNAVVDGRTTYVSVPNYSSGTLYSNMIVISYNLGASDETVDIYDQLVENISFVTNVGDLSLCHDSIAGSDSGLCVSDLDCSTGSTCGSSKKKLVRDIDRLNDITDLASSIASTTPQLVSGTYVRSLDASAWTSWDDVLADEIGDSIEPDPLNAYNGCGAGAYSSYDSETCVNQTTGAYVCPVGSYTYHYRALGSDGYMLGAELEFQSGTWATDIDLDTTDNRQINIGALGSGDGFANGPAFCNGTTVWGVSSTCGDGIVGSGETCEIGDTSVGASCTTSTSLSGFYVTECNSTCTGYTTPTDALCDPLSCGNGVIEGAEQCDDGSLNGSYGFCGADCTDADRVYCGDGSLAGGELCDCGAVTPPGGAAYGGGACSILNGVYSTSLANTCAWDCSGPGPYCGDEQVDDAEECDGNTDSYSEKLCSVGTSTDGNKCDSDDDCVSLTFSYDGESYVGTQSVGTCGVTSLADDCPYTTVCVEGDPDKMGLACTVDSYCNSSAGGDGVCSTYAYQTTRTRTCNSSSCIWVEDWEDILCRAPGSCGDGIVDDGEECDDGNDDSSDACTIECTLNVCGDGYFYAGEEQCDEGDDNGTLCTASYGSTCTYCNEDCKAVSSSGSFCGDGVINGSEFCDGLDVPYTYYSLTLDSIAAGYCDPDLLYSSSADGSSSCLELGVCNGGTDNGQKCYQFLSCGGGGVCVFPQCNASCGTMCPFSYDAQRLMIKTNKLGASRSYTADVESFSTAITRLSAGNSSTLYIPACSVADGLSLTLDDQNRDYPDVEIMLLLDKSYSMSTTLGSSTRIAVLRQAVDDAVVSLFDAYDGVDADMSIGWAYISGEHDFADSGKFVVMPPSSEKDTVRSSISSGLATVDSVLGTPIYQSIQDANNEFSSDPNTVKYMIIFTDGSITNYDYADISWSNLGYSTIPAWGLATITSSDYMRAVSLQLDDIKDLGVEVFSAVFTSNSCDITQMQRWSSMDCDAEALGCAGQRIEGNYICVAPSNGITYAYSATDSAGIESMYDQIVNSILNITVSVIIDGETASTTIANGSSRAITLPDTFSCDDSAEQSATVRATFNGSGTIRLSNIVLNMCTQ